MTYWYETPDDQKDSWHWLGLALSVASTIGLDRDTEQQNLNMREKRLRKRLWWSCVMRDPILAIGMRRPLRIGKANNNISMLTVDDFDLSAVPADTSPISARCSMAQDSRKQHQRAILCIEQAKLCQTMANILSVQYDILDSPPDGIARDYNSKSTAVLLPIRHEPDMVEFNRCDEDLKRWLDKLPREAKYIPLDPRARDGADRGLVLVRAMTHLFYSAAVIALHRPRSLFASFLNPTQVPPPTRASRANIRHAATEITFILRDLYRHGLSRQLPLTALNAIVPAILSHLLEVQTSNEARAAYADCMLVLEELCDSHSAAEFSVQFLAIVAHRIGASSSGGTQRPNLHLKTAAIQSTLSIEETPSVDKSFQNGASLHPRSELAMDYTNTASLKPPHWMENGENTHLSSFDITAHDDIFSLAEVEALFSPWTGMDFIDTAS